MIAQTISRSSDRKEMARAGGAPSGTREGVREGEGEDRRFDLFDVSNRPNLA
jgi:hypothetical protein